MEPSERMLPKVGYPDSRYERRVLRSTVPLNPHPPSRHCPCHILMHDPRPRLCVEVLAVEVPSGSEHCYCEASRAEARA
eukprot:5961273-Amphidinium_carterae.1